MSMKPSPTIHLSEFLQRRSNGGWKSAKENFIRRFRRWLSILPAMSSEPERVF
ncbi:hypothetical protein V1506DRAFT_507786, partial [Lipomyces tetrasporus]